jgi:hypothetical protein
MLDSDLYVELPKGTYHSPSFIKPVSQVNFETLRGFRSVYFFGQEAMEIITERNSVSGIDNCPVYSDTLFVDFDDGDNSKEMFKTILQVQGIAFQIFFSGRKGCHFHIPIEPMWGADVPYSQKMWVESLGVKTADLSIYKHTGLIRLTGTIHHVTGLKKKLIDTAEGKTLYIPIIPKPKVTFEVEDYGGSHIAAGLAIALHSFLDTPGPGGRHSRLVSIAKSLIEGGMSDGATREILCLVNNEWLEPKPDKEIEGCLERAKRWIRQSKG